MSWNNDVKKLLKNWSKQISINEREHMIRSFRYKRINNFLIIFDIIGKGTIFTTLLSIVSNQYFNYDLLIFVTIVEAFTIVTEGLSVYYDFSVLSQKHVEAARNYNNLKKLIDSTLSIDKSERGDPKSFLQLVIKRFKDISENSLALPYTKSVEINYEENPVKELSLKQTCENITPTKNEEVKFYQKLEKDKYMDYQWNRFETEVENI